MNARDFLRAALGAAALMLAACGGSDDATPPANQVGPAGGTVAGPNGTQLVVPAGALSAPVVITITPAVTSPPLPAAQQTLGTIYDFGPAGTTFAVPVTVTLPLDPAQVPAGARLRMLHGNATTWAELPGLAVGASSASAQTTSFSTFTMTFGNSAPLITTQPVAASVVAPAAASFSVAFTGTPGLDVQWERSNDGGMTWANATTLQSVTTSPGSSALPLTATSASAASAGGDNGALFRALLSNVETPAGMPVVSNVVALTVTTAPPTTAELTVAIAPAGGGSVSSVPAGIACGVDCSEIYALDTAVTLTATPAAGFVFSSWSSDCPGGGATMSAARACTATFTATAPAVSLGRIGSGDHFSVAVSATGVPYAWGQASVLGNGATLDRPTAAPLGTLNAVRSVSAGSIAAMAIRTDGTLWAWGYRGSIDCMFGGSAPTPYRITGASNVARVRMGAAHSLLLGSDGVVRALGCNFSGQLGRAGTDPATTPVAVAGLPAGITAVAAAGDLSLALDGGGNVWAWGVGALGDGTPLVTSRFTPVQIPGLAGVVAIAAGSGHGLAVKSDGSVWAWGSNLNGKLGDGTLADRLTPVATLLSAQALPAMRITAIAAGDQNSLALRGDGIVLSWGINETGQLGSGSSSPGFRSQPAPVINLTGVAGIEMGSSLGHGLAVKSDGTVWSWGHNNFGQLGNGTIGPSSSTPVQVTGLSL